MTEDQIRDRLRELERIIDPTECIELSNALNFYVMDYESSLIEAKLAASNEWLKIKELGKSDAVTTKMWETSDIYQKRLKVEIFMHQLKRLRQDLRDHFGILTNKRF